MDFSTPTLSVPLSFLISEGRYVLAFGFNITLSLATIFLAGASAVSLAKTFWLVVLRLEPVT